MTKYCFSAIAVCALVAVNLLGCSKGSASAVVDDGKQPPIYEFSISPDSRRIVIRGFSWDLKVCDLKSKKILQLLRHGDSFASSVVYHPKRDAILVSFVNGSVTLWEHAESQYICRVIGQHSDRVKVSRFSADGRLAATGDDSGVICLWRFDEKPRIIKRWTTSCPVAALEFSPDGALLATAGRHKSVLTLRSTDIASKSERVITYGSNLQAVAFSRDGQFLAVGDNVGNLTLKNLMTDQIVWTKRIYESGIRSVAFSPNGRQLAVTGRLENWVEFRSIATGELQDEYAAHRSSIGHIEFTDSGQLVTCGHDGHIHEGPNDSIE